jgi:hypothetical protein
LIRKNTFYCRYGVFKVRVSSVPTRRTAFGGSLKTQQREPALSSRHRGRRCSRRAEDTGRPEGHRTVPTPTGVRAPVFPRKEVIQPQLPLRLPCSRDPPCRHGAWTLSSS